MVQVSYVRLPLGIFAFSHFMNFLPLVSLVISFRPLILLHKDLDLWSKFSVLDCLYAFMPLVTLGISAFVHF